MPMFLCGRVLAGIGQGLWLANVNIYICEIAPSNYRGSLIALPQLMVTVGIFLSYFTCLGSVKMTSSMAWRSPYIIMGILSSLLGISCIFLPQSPRWLMLHHQREKAVKAIQRLDMDAVEAENYTMGTQETAQNETQCNKVKQLIVLFRPEYKSKSMLAAFLLLMVGLSGIDGILYYAPVLFGQAGIPTKTADFLASGCSAILMLAVSIPAAIFAEKWGRRTAMLLGGAGLSTCMFLMGSLYASNSVRASGVGRWFVIIFIFLFAAVYCVTWAVAGKIYASEILPTKLFIGETKLLKRSINPVGQLVRCIHNTHIPLEVFICAVFSIWKSFLCDHDRSGALYARDQGEVFGGDSAGLPGSDISIADTDKDSDDGYSVIFTAPRKVLFFWPIYRERT
ncbi:hypothetical protein UA08_06503 [Talaromyces atroroseus]|uniref:Major facilitator superfamily (MFS) profile domain-containing protein n=1 Tax=Talaromyces atroroseus TaxID=1441469 RepID=A0A225ASR5_TALAT|nr:hypothetical protein UA08_06503 [Talaromyces atroroseus]OKL57996.1 hypothetical protein UA08_06503 [Talaromyces atroroseus]